MHNCYNVQIKRFIEDFYFKFYLNSSDLNFYCLDESLHGYIIYFLEFLNHLLRWDTSDSYIFYPQSKWFWKSVCTWIFKIFCHSTVVLWLLEPSIFNGYWIILTITDLTLQFIQFANNYYYSKSLRLDLKRIKISFLKEGHMQKNGFIFATLI